MSRSLADIVLDFIAELRLAGVRISIAESLDAMRAIAAAGLSRVRMREALRASLIKDEADNSTFDALFGSFFEAPHRSSGDRRNSRGARIGVSGSGHGSGAGTDVRPEVTKPTLPLPTSDKPDTSTAEDDHQAGGKLLDSEGIDDAAGAEAAITESRFGQDFGSSLKWLDKTDARDLDAGTAGRIQRIETMPFADYSQLEYEQARDTLAILQRRLRLRLGRRMRVARRGRIDLRRTLHAAVQHGGALIDPRFRSRRPKHLDLLMLVDISGSVHYAATLMLELMAGARECFRRMHAFIFIDRLAAADFEQGHLVMTPPLDLHARSDYGRVGAELLAKHSGLLTRTTVTVVMGDARNNRRPPRLDLMRDIVRRCHSVMWLNPEPLDRWDSGDSIISAYSRVIPVIPSTNLRMLETALQTIG